MTIEDELRASLAPLLRSIGATSVSPDEATDTDIMLEWEGSPALAIQLDFGATTAAQLKSVEEELGAPMAELDRTQKQAAIRILDERGAFSLRKAIEDIADAMSVSRITIYNYLNAIRENE